MKYTGMPAGLWLLFRPSFQHRLTADLGFTSVSMLYMVIAIEEEFDIRFENVGAADFDTLGEVIDYIEAKLQ